MLVVRETRDAWPHDLGQGDDDVGRQELAAGEPKRAVERGNSCRARNELNSRAVQLTPERLARGRPKDFQRRVLAGHDHDVGVGDPALAQRGGAQQCELIKRQQPAHAGRRGECQAQGRIGDHSANGPLDDAGAHRPAEGERARHRLARAGSGGHDEDVVRQAVAVARTHMMRFRLH